jgi:hypothetical protein
MNTDTFWAKVAAPPPSPAPVLARRWLRKPYFVELEDGMLIGPFNFRGEAIAAKRRFVYRQRKAARK